ncbi:MAG: DUF502 domain-containing protein [Alphaproteobacteria bacterium]
MTPKTGENHGAGPQRTQSEPKRAGRWRPHLKLRTYFLTGLVVAAPIAITVYLTVAVVSFVDSQVVRLIPNAFRSWTEVPFTIPGIGVLVVAIALVFLGAFTANVAGRWLIGLGERLVARMPVVRNVYHGLKQIFETVLAQSDQSFKQVAMIEYPRPGVWALAFVTGATKGEVQARSNEELLSLFLPTTPNPTSGYLLFVPRKDVVILDMTVEEGAKLIISGGLVTPPFPRGEGELPLAARQGEERKAIAPAAEEAREATGEVRTAGKAGP